MKGNQNVSTKQSDSYFSTGFALGYLYKDIKNELNSIGSASGGSFTPIELALRLSRLLSAEEVRSELGSAESMSQVWSHSAGRTKASESATASVPEVHVRAHGSRTLSKKARANIARAQRARWAKIRAADKSGNTGWPKTAAGRKKEAAKRRMKALQNKEARAA
jgi:hypothetical protein